MAIEIEKKYRLTQDQREAILRRLPQIGATDEGTEFEENTLYGGQTLDLNRSILRLRRVGQRAILTYKASVMSESDAKHRLEEETTIGNAKALHEILRALGFSASLVYEKRRQTWLLGDATVEIDELPFGLFMEIEADEDEIRRIERELSIEDLTAELATYPQLAREHGKPRNGIIAARFE